MVTMSERIEDRVAPATPVPGAVPMDAYDYGLPESAIAQYPVEPRSAARLLIGPGLEGNTAPAHAIDGRPPPAAAAG